MAFSLYITIQKTLTFKKFNRLLYKYYPRFSKICKISAHLNQFLVLLYDCMLSLKRFLSIDKLLKKLLLKIQLLLYIVKPKNLNIFFDETKTTTKAKVTNKHIHLKKLYTHL